MLLSTSTAVAARVVATAAEVARVIPASVSAVVVTDHNNMVVSVT
jgi:hypothetical protein